MLKVSSQKKEKMSSGVIVIDVDDSSLRVGIYAEGEMRSGPEEVPGLVGFIRGVPAFSFIRNREQLAGQTLVTSELRPLCLVERAILGGCITGVEPNFELLLHSVFYETLKVIPEEFSFLLSLPLAAFETEDQAPSFKVLAFLGILFQTFNMRLGSVQLRPDMLLSMVLATAGISGEDTFVLVDIGQDHTKVSVYNSNGSVNHKILRNIGVRRMDTHVRDIMWTELEVYSYSQSISTAVAIEIIREIPYKTNFETGMSLFQQECEELKGGKILGSEIEHAYNLISESHQSLFDRFQLGGSLGSRTSKFLQKVGAPNDSRVFMTGKTESLRVIGDTLQEILLDAMGSSLISVEVLPAVPAFLGCNILLDSQNPLELQCREELTSKFSD